MNANNEFEVFDGLINASSVREVLDTYRRLNGLLSLAAGNFQYFTRLRMNLNSKQILKYNKIHSILQKLEKRSQQKLYHNNCLLRGQRVLVIGGGISGLRVAIELLLLGANVICVEKRDTFSRNNVIHLWPNVISDLKLLGAKRFYGKFCVGAIDHISIRQIQLILLKIALIFGLDFRPNIEFRELCPRLTTPTPAAACGQQCQCCCHSHRKSSVTTDGANCHFQSTVTGEEVEVVEELNRMAFDVVIGSDGRRNTLFQDFPRKEFRGKLAIAITANFVNRRTEPEVRVPEISGVSYIYNQKWFRSLLAETGIQLENICYYRDETHYFVMTATKHSLLSRGVIENDFPETHLLLSDTNINRQQLLRYARDAAHWTSGLRDLEFAQNALNSADVALFDFTSVYAARNASRAKRVFTKCCQPIEEENSKHVLMLLTGDSLLEPFWPTGSGAGRGFLSALDAAYTCVQWALKVDQSGATDSYDAMVDVIAERESIYRLLAQTTPENISTKEFSFLPNNRYQNWSKNSIPEIRKQILHLIGSQLPNNETMAAKRARRATVAITTRDLQESQSEKNRATEEMDFKDDTKTTRRDDRIDRKSDWLLGSKKPEIIERAKNLEQILSEKNVFKPKLEKVGKIEDNDWNVRVWKQNTLFETKNGSKSGKPVLKNSKEILNSRKEKIEEKLFQKTTKDDKKTTQHDVSSQQWIQTLSEELTQRMAKDSGNKFPEVVRTPELPVPSSSMPKCSRCSLDVSAMERISVSGDILHRSCLRCSKCGISLRLNEFRNELKFLCIYCLKRNSNLNSNLKSKQLFLSRVETIDFRERAEFENQNFQVVDRTPVNANAPPTDDTPTDDSDDTSCSMTTTDDSDDWETQSEESESRAPAVEEPMSASIPSICVTEVSSGRQMGRQDYRYLGSFTEKLFRSKSQPMIALRRDFKPKTTKETTEDDDETTLPFADICDQNGHHFSPVRSLRAPIIDFSDI